MAEYIDREEAKKWVVAFASEKYHIDITRINPDANPRIAAFYGLYEAYKLLDEVPASDVRLEKHGEWSEEEFDCDFSSVNIKSVCISKCSLCGHISLEKRPNYCHYCGAKMDVKSGG